MDGTPPATAPATTAELSLPELADRITELAGHLNAANHRWLTLIAEFDRRNGWHDGALHSCAHWLNFKCGLDLGAAREKVRVARALEGLPRIGAAMARGALSYSKVRALTRVAEPANEDYFLSIALHGTAHHVEKLVRHYRHLLPPSDLDVEEDEDAGLRDAPKPWNRPHSAAVRRADALALVAESFLARRDPAGGGLAERYQVVVHVDAATLRHGSAGRCELEDGPALPAATVRRIACDAGIVGIVENDSGEALDVGRKTRSIPPAIRRALKVRDKGCRFPGCTHDRWVDAHHIEHWADGGATKLANLVLLCRFHHRLVHEGGVEIRSLDDGAVRFVRSDGRDFDEHPARRREVHWSVLVDAHAGEGIAIDADTAATQWRGERMDYQLALDVLVQKRELARDVAAATHDDHA